VYAKPANSKTALVPGVLYDPIEEMPELVTGGGMRGVAEALRSTITGLGPVLDSQGIPSEGRVFVGFVVQADGCVSGARIVRGLNPNCDTVALKAVRQLPRFKPGHQLGRTVPVSMTVPIRFRTGQAIIGP
jgi:protein TonB